LHFLAQFTRQDRGQGTSYDMTTDMGRDKGSVLGIHDHSLAYDNEALLNPRQLVET
jgi:hypothetical protein